MKGSVFLSACAACCLVWAATVAVAAAADPARPTAAKAATPRAVSPAKKSVNSTAAKPPAVKPKAGATKSDKATAKPGKPVQKPGEVLDVDWRDLLPENERSHYSAVAPPPVHGPLGEGGPPAVQKITTTVNADLASLTVRLPGFVVPIGTPRNGLITEFFLVPYIGACIHVPPPPPNQMVYVTSATGIPEAAIHEAYWVTGKMRVEDRTTPLGIAAYALSAGKVDLYQY
ncbi:MAG: DUF3299 domain-containing protein [Gammaproteobacteria bacterium]